MSRTVAVAGVVAVAAACCADAAGPAVPRRTAAATSQATTGVAPLAAAVPDPDGERAAQRVVGAIRSAVPGATVGLEVFDAERGRVVTSAGADQRFHSASVVKLLIAVDAVTAAGTAPPDGALRDQVHQMLAYSDDAVADALWDAGGGPAIVSRMTSLLGLTGTSPPEDPGEWGDTLITAQDMVAVYRYVTGTLPARARTVVLDALAQAGPQAADGFDQYFGIPDGLPGVTRAVKQGWMRSADEVVLHTTGVLDPAARYVVVLLTAAPSDTSWAVATQAVTAGAGALADVISAEPGGVH